MEILQSVCCLVNFRCCVTQHVVKIGSSPLEARAVLAFLERTEAWLPVGIVGIDGRKRPGASVSGFN